MSINLPILLGLLACLPHVFAEEASQDWSKKLKNLPKKPNIVLILADDLGYGDLASYGSPSAEWGGIDDLASQGLRFSQAYSADSMCSPSRGALLSGRLPVRLGLVGGRRVFVPFDKGGLPAEELTLPEALLQAGYDTGMVGKWHLGINAVNSTDGAHLPSKHGFRYVGTNLPMSNLWECAERWEKDIVKGVFEEIGTVGPDPLKCFLYRGDKLSQQPIHFANLTPTLVQEFKNFATSTAKPFFFFFSFPQVHSYQFADEAFEGRSERGLYGDSLNEMHWAVKEIKEHVTGLDSETLVVFLSDHGPHRELCNLGGSTGGLRGGKSNSFEGGFRIPLVVWWPGAVEAGLSRAVVSALDLFPTLARLAGAPPPREPSDGLPVPQLLLGWRRDAAQELTSERPILFYCNKQLMAARLRQFKLHFLTSPEFAGDEHCPHGTPLKDWYVLQTCNDAKLTRHSPPLIFDLGVDPFERFPLDTEAQEILALIEEAEAVVAKHKASLAEVPDQMGHFNPGVIPCAHYPKCRLNYPLDELGRHLPKDEL